MLVTSIFSFSHVFKGPFPYGCSKSGLFGQGVNSLPYNPDFQRHPPPPPKKKVLENTVGKGENAGNKHFLLFPQCFLL